MSAALSSLTDLFMPTSTFCEKNFEFQPDGMKVQKVSTKLYELSED